MSSDTSQLLSIVAKRLAKTAASAFRSSIDHLGRRTFRDSRVATSAVIVVAAVRLVLKLAKRKSEVAYSVVLKAGESVEVRHLASAAPPSQPDTDEPSTDERADERASEGSDASA